MYYDMTKKALLMGRYNVAGLTKLRDVTLDKYLSDGDINQIERDELMNMVVTALSV